VDDETFAEWFKAVNSLKDEELVESEMRRFIAKHQTPAKIKNE